MKLVILAGGKGSRFVEETQNKPKPMITIGEIPIILHIMKYYSQFGVKDFIICSGYKGEKINEFFINFQKNYSNIKIDFINKSTEILDKNFYDWTISIIKSDENTDTAGRLLSIKKYINKKEDFYFTYGDGLANVDLNKQLDFYNKQKKICMVTGVKYQNKYGVIKEKNNLIYQFDEKKHSRSDTINGGFFILNQKIFNYIKGKKSSFEKSVIKKLVKDNEICVYKHQGFWQSMDNIRERNYLEELWLLNKAPWKI